MPPPPAEPFASRIFLGPALRTQPDRRLVTLVRKGYETAFEEIVRRYRKPLDRFAAAIVGGRSEDVTQDAFSKALLALRGTTTEIELRPWLYRIVRNTALNELRDRPPATEELGEALTSGRSTAEEAERREEMTDLMERLRALPEPQRAAIVMRELEGLSHEEIAAALGVSGGGARQAIYRARAALRNGFGMLIPLPLLRVLFDHGAEAAGAGGGAAAAAGAASAAGGGGGVTLGALSAGGALKVGVATALLAGSVGAGVAMQHDRGERGPEPAAASASQLPGGGNQSGNSSGPGGPGQVPLLSSSAVSGGDDGRGSGGDGHGEQNRGDDRGPDGGDTDDEGFEDSSQVGAGPGHDGNHDGQSGHGGRGPSQSGHSGPRGGSDGDHSGEGTSGGGHAGHPNSGGSGGGDGLGESGGSNGGRSHDAGTGSGGGGNGGSDGGDSSGGGGSENRGPGGGSESSGGPAPTVSPPPVTEPPPEGGVGSDDGSGSGSEGSGKDDS
jgi:RNA polymerase sigma factor (sigma-70 family)